MLRPFRQPSVAGQNRQSPPFKPYVWGGVPGPMIGLPGPHTAAAAEPEEPAEAETSGDAPRRKG